MVFDLDDAVLVADGIELEVDEAPAGVALHRRQAHVDLEPPVGGIVAPPSDEPLVGREQHGDVERKRRP